MRYGLTALTALAAVTLLAPAAPAKVKSTKLPEGTEVIIVGRISSPPRGVRNEQKMQVSIGPNKVDYTLHFNDAVILAPNGDRIDEDRLDDRQWVRAEGTVMDDPRRIRVSRMRVISPHDKMRSLHGTPHYRAGFAHGYIMWPKSSVAGSRQYHRASQ
jgi:hypothetical protein